MVQVKLQQSQLAERSQKVNAYVLRPNIFLLVRYASDRRVCEMALEPRHTGQEKPRFWTQPYLDQDELDRLVEELGAIASAAAGFAALRWWSRLRGRPALTLLDATRLIHLKLPGWHEGPPDGKLRVWHDSDGDVLSLAVLLEPAGPPSACDDEALMHWCRGLAASRNAGLIEAVRIAGQTKPAIKLIYKRLQMPAYIYTGMLYTGMLLTAAKEAHLVWTIVAAERGMTGVREAVITAELMDAGLTIEDWERCWAQDPYDPTYQGVDRSVLHFTSDDESYDERFPQHPLSKVRRVLAALPDQVELLSPTS